MKTEFLQNFKVGDQSLPKEIIDAILAENGRDVEAAKKPFADYDTIKGQLATAQETIKGFESQDIEGVRKSAKEWEDKYNQAIEDHKSKLADMEFDGVLKDAIAAAKGKSEKAIRALLDVDALKASKNQAVDIKDALDALQKDSGFLFGTEQDPPPYAGGTGAGAGGAYDSNAAMRRLCPCPEHTGLKRTNAFCLPARSIFFGMKVPGSGKLQGR